MSLIPIVSFNVAATQVSDQDSGDTVSLNHAGLPTAATFLLVQSSSIESNFMVQATSPEPGLAQCLFRIGSLALSPPYLLIILVS